MDSLRCDYCKAVRKKAQLFYVARGTVRRNYPCAVCVQRMLGQGDFRAKRDAYASILRAAGIRGDGSW
ncbi:MAG: hypothetical protein EBR82_30630 [Caulobacteraceae bacterium]|nr:hypothetical protein [Caulobacteraceae bacterium]